MIGDFNLKIFTTGRKLVDTEVSEVVLPSFDGEVGVLGGHKNFVGLLGTGVLKIVRGGDDYWFMVSSGVYEVRNGELTILAEVGEEAKDVDVSLAKEVFSELEKQASEKSIFDPTYEDTRVEFERAQARIEAHRRTELLN